MEPFEVLVVDIFDENEPKEVEPSYEDQMKVVFPKDKEELIEFLNRCRLKDYEVMLCPRCNVVFDREATKELEKENSYQSKKVVR